MKKVLVNTFVLIAFITVSWLLADFAAKHDWSQYTNKKPDLSGKIVFKHYPKGITPNEYNPYNDYIWNYKPEKKHKGNEKYFYVLNCKLPNNFDDENYLLFNPKDAVNISGSAGEQKLTLFAKNIDLNYFNDFEIIEK